MLPSTHSTPTTLEGIMVTLVGTLTAHASRRVSEVGALLGLLSGLLLIAAAVPSFRKWGLVLGGLLLVVGFALIIYALHYGMSPYRLK
jgi:mannose/fructose/N-acetylgalactosamine-specific phosphotransferase system component IIC